MRARPVVAGVGVLHADVVEQRRVPVARRRSGRRAGAASATGERPAGRPRRRRGRACAARRPRAPRAPSRAAAAASSKCGREACGSPAVRSSRPRSSARRTRDSGVGGHQRIEDGVGVVVPLLQPERPGDLRHRPGRRRLLRLGRHGAEALSLPTGSEKSHRSRRSVPMAGQRRVEASSWRSRRARPGGEARVGQEPSRPPPFRFGVGVRSLSRCSGCSGGSPGCGTP